MNRNISAETIAMLKDALSKGDEELAKAWIQGTNAVSGITAYDLEAPSKKLYPVLTPLRNRIPRVGGGRGIQANWRAVTGINTADLSMGVSDGNRGGVITTTTADVLAIFREFGLEDYVTWAADFDAVGFEDKKALATEGLLRAVMIGEEKLILGGLGTWNLIRTPTPTCTPTAASGTCTYAHDPYTVYCIALNLAGYKNSTINSIVQDVTRAMADGSGTDTFGGGSARVSVAQTASCGGTNTGYGIACTVAAVPGAVAYAWFWGPSGTGAACGAITTTNYYMITTDLPTGTQTYAALDNASDHSKNAYEFDGILSQVAKTASGSYVKSLDNAVLASGSDGGITQIDDALQSFWDNYRLSPTDIWVSSQEKKNIRAKIMNGSATAAQRFVFNVEQGQLKGGTLAVSYLNPFVMNGKAEEIPINLHPDLPPGTILFTTDELPYPLSNVTNVLQMKLRRDYFAINWPMTKRKYEYGVYFDGVLQNYFPPAFGMITNIKNG